MNFGGELIAGALLRRYKRFLADVQLASGEVVTAHTANTGSMMTCSAPGSRVLLSDHDGSDRKLRYSLELVRTGRVWVGVNTMRANAIVAEAIERGCVPELAAYDALRREVPYGARSRIDILLESGDRRCLVEVKNVTLVYGRAAYFPDAVTARGRKHLEELTAEVRKGHRAVMFYLVSRADADVFRPADFIDRAYGDALRQAAAAGVEALAYRARITRRGITLGKRLPAALDVAADPR